MIILSPTRALTSLESSLEILARIGVTETLVFLLLFIAAQKSKTFVSNAKATIQ
jgi:hypothetical protein